MAGWFTAKASNLGVYLGNKTWNHCRITYMIACLAARFLQTHSKDLDRWFSG